MSSPSFPLRNKARVFIPMIILPACRSSYGCSIWPNNIIGWVSFTLQPVSNNVLTFHYPHNISNLHVLLRCLFGTLFDAFFNLLENSFILFYFYLFIYMFIAHSQAAISTSNPSFLWDCGQIQFNSWDQVAVTVSYHVHDNKLCH